MNRCAMLGAASIVFAACAVAAGQWDETAKLVPDETVAGDNFGWDSAMFEDLAVVGAPGGNTAYLIDVSDPQSPMLVGNPLVDPDCQAGGGFGWSVAIHWNRVIVGAPSDLNGAGSAAVFDVTDPHNPVLICRLTADDGEPGDAFGWDVAIDRNIVAIGARSDDGQRGSAYLFDAATCSQLAKIIADEPESPDHFGEAVAIDYPLLVVGVELDAEAGVDAGSAHVYDISDPANPIWYYMLLGDDTAAYDHFGTAVAIDGTTVVVGASGHDDPAVDCGAAYVFDVSDPDAYVQTHKLTAADAENDKAELGYTVDIDGEWIIAGAHQDNTEFINAGSAYLFNLDRGSQCKIIASDTEEDDRFGYVAIDRKTAVVGSPWDDDGGSKAGSAYVFHLLPCPWDVNFDGMVDIDDIFEILGNWGDCQ